MVTMPGAEKLRRLPGRQRRAGRHDQPHPGNRMSRTLALYGAAAAAGPHWPSSLSGGLLGAAIMVVIVIAVLTAVRALASRGRSGRRGRRSPGGYR